MNACARGKPPDLARAHALDTLRSYCERDTNAALDESRAVRRGHATTHASSSTQNDDRG